MDITIVRAFFMWCTIINGGVLIFSSIMCTFAGSWVHKVHSQFFPISRDAFNIAIYSFIGLYKIFFITLNLVPYIALLIIG